MKNRLLAEQWLGRAKSNLSRAKLGRVNPNIFYEDLCFDCQQAGEKALKALLILRDIVPPPTHSLSVLFESLETHGITIPGEMKGTVALSYYAVTTPVSMKPLLNPIIHMRWNWVNWLLRGLTNSSGINT